MPGVRAIESRSPPGFATSPLSCAPGDLVGHAPLKPLDHTPAVGAGISKVARDMSELWTYWLPDSFGRATLPRPSRRIGHEQLAPFRDATEIELRAPPPA
jgi:hypothetical protein